jgi:hypothetical protein
MCSTQSVCPLSAKSGHQQRLFDHFVGAGEKRRRHVEAKRERRLSELVDVI